MSKSDRFAAEPSVEDVLASIRQMMAETETISTPPNAGPSKQINSGFESLDTDVLALTKTLPPRNEALLPSELNGLPFQSQAHRVQGKLSQEAMEQMIARLTEPLVRQWLERNLPQVVESVVTKEVRALLRQIKVQD